MTKKLTKKEFDSYKNLFEQAIIDNNSRPFVQFFGIYEDYFKINDHENNLKKACLANCPEVLVTLVRVDLREYLFVNCFQTLSTTTHTKCVEALLEVVKPEGKKFTQAFIDDLLFASIERNNLTMASWCLDNNAKLVDRNFDFQPLDYAAQYNAKDIFDLLLKKGAKLHHDRDAALFKAYRYENFDLFFHILSIDPTTKISKDLFNYIPEGKETIYEDVFIKLVPFIVNQTMQKYALETAVRFKFYNAASTMLEARFDACFKKPALQALENNDQDMIKLLMDYGFNPETLSSKETYRVTMDMKEIFTTYPRMLKIKENLENNLSHCSNKSVKHKI